MVYCAVFGCKNERYKSKSKVDGRKFLRFYKFPKDPKLAKNWKTRIGRRIEDITEKMQVCSDHFADEDFQNYTKIRNFYYEGMHIKLKDTAIPNTDRETQYFIKSKVADTPPSAQSKRSRERIRRDGQSINAFIEEQEKILQSPSSSSQVDNSTNLTTGDPCMDDQIQNEMDGRRHTETQSICSCKCTCYDGENRTQTSQLEEAGTNMQSRYLRIILWM